MERLQRRSGLSATKPALVDRQSHADLEPVAEGQAIRQRPDQGPAPLSFAQERMWLLHELEPDSPAYNVVRAYRLSGPLHLPALEHSLNEIVRRHEALRTTFSAPAGQPVQVIAPDHTIHLPLLDLRDLPADQRESEARRLCLERVRVPFDLRRGPLFRPALLQLADNDQILLLSMHHIVSDGWSMGVLIRELSALYKGFLQGDPSPLPDLPIQYADYALWQRQWLQGELLVVQLAYWRDQLAGAPQMLDLPGDHPRPEIASYEGAVQAATLPQDLTRALQALARQEGTTLFMVLLAAFQTLLHRYTGETDIVVGSPIANRTRPEIEPLIGFFVNTLALRIDLSGNPTFRHLLSRVRPTCLGAYSHQELPFEKLVQQLETGHDSSRSPLFQTMMVLQNAPSHELQLPGLRASPEVIETGTARFDLSLVLENVEEHIRARLVYNTDLFEEATARRMLGHFLTLLDGIVAKPDQRIGELPLLSPAEQYQLLVTWNDTWADRPRDLCLHRLFERQVDRTPGAVAVAFGEEQVTYRELNRRANQLAHHLKSIGLGPETLVGLCVMRSVEWVVGFLGILKAGAAVVPIDPKLPPERLLFLLQKARPSCVVTQMELADRLSGYEGHRVFLDGDMGSNVLDCRQNPDSRTGASNLAYMILTSGSTGDPKGVMIEHRGLVNLTLTQIDAYGVRPGTRFLQTFALGFDASIAQITRPLCAGATLQLVPEESLLPGPEMIRLLRETGVTHLNLLPSLLHLLPVDELPAVEVIIVGGEPCPPELVTRWAPGRRFFNGYGPTEATIGSALHECVANGQTPPIGRPIANVQCYILDKHLQPVPAGVPGELYISGVGLARGYWGRPDLTAASFIPNPFIDKPGMRMYRTGDLAKYLPDGNIQFLGRIDSQVKIRGARVELGEIEAVLRQHPGVRAAVAVLKQKSRGDERLVAYIVPEANTTSLPPDLREFLTKNLPSYMVPAAFVVLGAFPLTASGKIDRAALSEPEWSRDDLTQEYVAPRTLIEHALATIWKEVLGIGEIGIHDSFFDLGGHSLLATQVISRVRTTLQVDLPLRVIFDAPTIAGMAMVIEPRHSAAPAEIEMNQIMADLVQMTDEEVRRLLVERGTRNNGTQT